MMKKNLLALSSKRSIFFFFFFSLLTLLTAAAVASAMNEDTERLLNFKASLANPSILQNWIPYEHPCNYTAVFCKSSHVTSIDLNSIPLSVEFRSVASFLLTLNYLESLSLKSTNLKGNISMPTGFQCGPLLSTLDLSRNSLTGPFTYISHLGSCSSLKSLNLSGNLLDSSVGTSKTGLHVGTLQLLDLSFNKMSGQWDQFLSGCGEMTVLSLKGNAVAGDVDVSSCSKLVHLDISSNNFSATIPKLGDCAAMEFLDLSTNKFTGEIGNALSVCSQLSFLNISVNHFSGSIPPLPTNNLQFLYLADNDFVGQVPPELVEACPTLVELDLSKNNFSGGLPHALSACTSLQSIDISNNNFSGELPGDVLFSSMISLKTLIVSFNSFNGSLPNSVSKLTELETLDLNSNSLSGSIPSSLCQASLKVLYLQNNLLSGSIPTTLSNCSNLVSLDLSFNYLTGTIPSALGSLTKLRDMVFLLNQLEGEIPTELMYIQSLENLVLDYNFLTGNVPSELSNCTALNWISLSNNRLSGPLPGWFGQLSNLGILTLSNNSLSGPIPDELGDSRSLIWLDLNTNLLSGPIPSALFKHSGSVAVKIINDKRYAYIKTDGSKECHGAGNLLEFSGIRPEQLNRISTRNPCKFTPSVRVFNGMIHPTFKNNGSMILLDISHNFLSGSIPKEIGMLYYLQVLNLGSNNISGSIPPEIGDLKNLNVLDLSDNRLEGTIPQAISGCSMLSEANLSDNLLTGPIPLMGQLGTFSNSSYLNNSGLCGIPLPPCSVISASNRNSSHLKSHGKQASLARSIATSLLICLFCIFGLIFVAVKMRKMRREENSSLDVYVDSLSHSGAGHGNWTLTSTREALSINLSAFEKPLKKLTFADLLEATNGFHSNSLIGSGGFGNVYKAQLKDGSVVAIKKLIQVSGQGDREFTAEMETIGKIKNRNLVSLLGYCKVKEERLLVYEYMKYGSLEDVLHDSKKSGIKLDWTARRRIAIGAARGLAFLHHNCIPHIIHRDMKSSNVLIDENLDARVSDFGMARLMSAMDDTHLSVSTLAGTPGYVPPEYYQSFRCSTKGDVYSYGVVLLELLTGRRPTDSTDFGDNNLVGWVKHAKLRISDIFDPSLIKEDPGIKIELLQHLKVACACLDDRPWKRPTIVQVLAMFKEIQAGSGLDSVSTVNNDGVFCGVQMVEMNIKEVPEFIKH